MSNKRPLGGEWLKEYYKLDRYSLTHCSFLGSNPYMELTSTGNIEQTYAWRRTIYLAERCSSHNSRPPCKQS